jgi:hypothetical protein
MEAQLQWASQNVPAAPHRTGRTSPKPARADEGERTRAEAEAKRLRASLNELIDQGIRLAESRRGVQDDKGMDSLERHQRLLSREKELRQKLLEP